MRTVRWYEGPTSLELRRDSDWAWIGLVSEDGLNRLRMDVLEALDRLFIELRWGAVRRVVLSHVGWMHGRGLRACFRMRHDFSAGADLHEVATLNPHSADPFSRRGQRIMQHLLWAGWRTLTVLSGAVMGGACDLALSGHERWGVEGLRLAHPAAQHGILTGFGGTVRLKEVLGKEGADRLFKAFEQWDVNQALQRGAIQRSLQAEDVKAAVEHWLQGNEY